MLLSSGTLEGLKIRGVGGVCDVMTFDRIGFEKNVGALKLPPCPLKPMALTK